MPEYAKKIEAWLEEEKEEDKEQKKISPRQIKMKA